MNKRSHLIAISWVSASIGLIIMSFFLMNNESAQAALSNITSPVDITESGFDPAVITIEVGTTVVWTNQIQETVHLKSGSPYQVYLPLLLRNIGMLNTTTSPYSNTLANIHQRQGDWADEVILPGGSYTYTFTTAGNNPYFLATDKTITGAIIAEEPIPDFILTVSPNSQTVIPGQFVTYTVSLTATNGFAAPVTLSVSGLPTGASSDWTNNPVIPNNNTTMFITTTVSTMTGTHNLTVSGIGGGRSHSAQIELSVIDNREEDELPCLVIVGQNLLPSQPLPSVVVGCVSGTSSAIEWRYDNRGAFIGFDMTITDTGTVILETSIDIERAPSGRTLSYSGTVSALGLLNYFENVHNKYNDPGGLIGADVSKIYTASGNEYLMEITQYCPYATAPILTGYKVQVNGEEKVVGVCP